MADHPFNGKRTMTQAPLKIPRSAKASMILGLIGSSILPLVASLPAIILGHRAARQIKAAPHALRGEGLALGGLILGYLGVLYGVGLIALLPYLQANRHKALDKTEAIQTEQRTLANLEHLAKAALAYTLQNDGALPPSIESINPTRTYWKSPFDPNHPIQQPSYRLLHPEKKLDDLGDPVTLRLIEDRYRSWNGKRGVVYATGQTELVDD